jgi:ATP-dependent DNA helicase RecQ
MVMRDENPVFASLEEMAVALPSEAGDRAVSPCIFQLVRDGRVRRIAPQERLATLRLKPDVIGAPPTGTRLAVWELARRTAGRSNAPVAFSPEAWCGELELSRDQLHAALVGLSERGMLAYAAPDRVGGVELIDPSRPLQLDEKAIAARRAREHARLDRMIGYTRAACRRRYIVEYFGEPAPFNRCGTCDGCRAGVSLAPTPRPLTPDEEDVVIRLLSCLARMERHTNQHAWSVDLLVKTALGSEEEKLKSFGFDLLSTWGVLSATHGQGRWTAADLTDLVRALVDAGCLEEAYTTRRIQGKERTYREVGVAPLGWHVLRRAAPELQVAFPHAHKLVTKRPVAAAAGPEPQSGLMAALRDIRSDLARKSDVPLYVIASNKTLEDMARLRPLTRRALLDVHGMGEKRVDQYGGAFLSAIREWAAGA